MSPTAQLRPVLTTQGDRYAVAAIIVLIYFGVVRAHPVLGKRITASKPATAGQAIRLRQPLVTGAAVAATADGGAARAS